MSNENQNKRTSVCVIETQTEAPGCFQQLLKAAMADWQLKHNEKYPEQSSVTFSVFNNVNLSEILPEQEESGTTLREEFRKAMANEAHESGYQYVVNMVGELVAEVIDNEDQSAWYVLFPDTEYGSALGWHTETFDAKLLPMAETLNNFFREKYKVPCKTVKKFGVIGDYDICNSLAVLATNPDADPSKYGLCLPYTEFDEIAELLATEKPDRARIEDLFVKQVATLAYNFHLKSVSSEILIGNLQLEMLLLEIDPALNYGVFLKLLQNPDQSFWEVYHDAWQRRMRHLYNRNDWPAGVKLSSVLTYYAEIACGMIGCAGSLDEEDLGPDGLKNRIIDDAD